MGQRSEYYKQYYQVNRDRIRSKRRKIALVQGPSLFEVCGRLSTAVDCEQSTNLEQISSVDVNTSTVDDKTSTTDVDECQQCGQPSTPQNCPQSSKVDISTGNVDESTKSNSPQVVDSRPQFHKSGDDDLWSGSGTTATINLVSEQVAEAIQMLALKKLMPSARYKINFSAIIEAVLLAVLSCFVLFVTVQALQSIAPELISLVVAIEAVSVFFSFSLYGEKGLKLFLKVIVLLSCVVVTNYLIISHVIDRAEKSMADKKEKASLVAELKKDIETERAIISDLYARGRITLAAEHVKRVDQLTNKAQALQAEQTTSLNYRMTILQVIMRVILGVSMLIMNHRIVEIIGRKSYLKIEAMAGGER